MSLSVMGVRLVSDSVKQFAPAKINLSLRVIGRREDGFHDIESLMCPVTVFDSLDEACAAVGTVDVVDVFRDPVYVPEIVKDVIRLKIPYLWLQEGVIHDEAAGWAEADGIGLVMDRCMLKEHAHWNVVRAQA